MKGWKTMGKELFEQLFSLKGKTALVTGGYRGIGLTFSETFAEAGADVVITARNLKGCQAVAKEIAEKYGVRAMGKAMDVHDSKIVNQAVQEIADELGKIDILVNCAGVPGNQKPVHEMADEDLDDVMNVDFRGTFLASRAVAQVMIRQKSGKIINISSIMAKITARNVGGYSAAKAAVNMLTRAMALELMRYNIQVNALMPGYFLTPFNTEFFQTDAGKNLVKKMIPINRLGNVNELKSTALYLATCPAFLTGAEIIVDGGHTIP
jgi:NAD(P)-dependent dehydrogenase (short-subunit alcohol dehydrogenase family)